MTTKYTLPAILLGVVMIAGAFAFMPVQEASTVHTTILGNTLDLKVDSTGNTKAILDNTNASEITNLLVTCTTDVVIHEIRIELPASETQDEYAIAADTILVDSIAINHAAIDPAANTALNHHLMAGSDLAIGLDSTISLPSGDTLTIPITDEDTTDEANATATLTIIFESNSDSTTCAVA